MKISRIGIDLMGGDNPPPLILDAVLQVAEQLQEPHSFHLYVTEAWGKMLLVDFKQRISLLKYSSLEFHYCRDAIDMHEVPLQALRAKMGASMVVGLKCLKEQAIDAFVSAGNTGALVAAATLLLPKIAGVSRPGLLAVLPTKKEPISVIDVGGSLSCKTPQLLQFAAMGIAYVRCLRPGSIPTVGLLNVGREAKKGTREHQHLYAALHNLSLQQPKGLEIFRFFGNVEGRDVFEGTIDVLLTDGFTGNVFLKTAEGTAAFMLDLFASIGRATCAPQHASVLHAFQRDFNYTEQPGAILCGVDGVVVKCHGEASTRSVYHAIKGAMLLVKMNFTLAMQDSLRQIQTAFS